MNRTEYRPASFGRLPLAAGALLACAALMAPAHAQTARTLLVVAEPASGATAESAWAGAPLQGFLDRKKWQVQAVSAPAADLPLRPGDTLMVQLDPARHAAVDDYAAALASYVQAARARQAAAIVVTPTVPRAYRDGQAHNPYRAHADAALAVAARTGADAIDLNHSSKRWLDLLGETPSKLFYLDQGHSLNRQGAYTVACLVAQGWQQIEPTVRNVRPGECGASPRFDSFAEHTRPVIEHEADLAQKGYPPHGGTGDSVGYTFMASEGMPFVFRKRVLPEGGSMGLHAHYNDELYYVVRGQGRYLTAGKVYDVGPGDALLVRKGNYHGMIQIGREDLEIIIVYPSASRN